MTRILVALLVGLVFGLGLTISQMIDPAKVLGFLDVAGIADGSWDPSLALVMAGGLAVAFVGFKLVLQRGTPVFADRFQLPARRELDGRLIAGSAIFGIGWGLAGICPGPGLTALGLGYTDVALFVAAMLAGMGLNRLIALRPRPA
ncbi:MAG: DUF6691 family protein [Alphaproteobacteria bacterium]